MKKALSTYQALRQTQPNYHIRPQPTDTRRKLKERTQPMRMEGNILTLLNSQPMRMEYE